MLGLVFIFLGTDSFLNCYFELLFVEMWGTHCVFSLPFYINFATAKRKWNSVCLYVQVIHIKYEVVRIWNSWLLHKDLHFLLLGVIHMCHHSLLCNFYLELPHGGVWAFCLWNRLKKYQIHKMCIIEGGSTISKEVCGSISVETIFFT